MSGSLLFAIYRAATALAEPAARLLLRSRQRAGKEDPARIGERLGVPTRERPPGPLAWLHGASVGEGVALLPLIEALVERGLGVLVTTGTVNSARVMGSRLPSGVTHQYVPLDLPRAWRRFLKHWRPDIALLAESELWPNLVHQLTRRHVPLVLVNARMSTRSARGWGRAAGFIGDMLGRTALCLAQSQEDAVRFAALGAPHTQVTGQLKYDVAPPPAAPASVSELSALIGSRPTWVAASTHADEEALLLDVHAAVARVHPNLLTIILPRQPQRGPALAQACAAAGLPVALRSQGCAPGPTVGLYVADTIGEAGLLYRVADLVFVGRSLAGGGGQSPIEAAKLGAAILHGPSIDNQRDIYAGLDEAGGALEVADAAALAETLADLLGDPARVRRMSRAASAAVERQGGATGRSMAAMEPYLAAILGRTRP